MDLSTLEIPRHVHKPYREWKIVRTLDELTQAVKDGWSVVPPAPFDVGDPEPESDTEPEPTPTAEPETVKRGPGRPRKQP